MSGAKKDGAGAGFSPTRRLRVRGSVWTVVVTVLLGLVVWFAGAAGNTERVDRMWVGARIAEDGSARVTEVIDYDFGHPVDGRHGIYRDIPGLPYGIDDDEVRATMDGAPVPYELVYGDNNHQNIRVGDAGRTVSGLHRYRISYPLPDVVKKGRLAWDAVGTGWEVDLRNVEVQVTAPFGLDRVRCVRGRTGSRQSCPFTGTGDGRLGGAPGTIRAGHGVTVYASAGAPNGDGKAAALRPPTGATPTAEASPNPLRTALTVAGIALGCALSTVVALRLAGRDRRPDAPVEVRDAASPPEGLTPAQGGILLAERVEPHHQVAWLLHASLRRHISVRGTGRHPVLRRTPGLAGVPDADTTAVLDDMFAGRKEFVLGSRYDPLFRSAWNSLNTRLTAWMETSGLWQPSSARRVLAGRWAGLGLTLAGAVTACVGTVLNGAVKSSGPPVYSAGAALTGIGIALLFHSWELHSRTAEGAALRLQVEGFRRWLGGAAARPEGEVPYDKDQLELLTAWAVALGMAERWERTVAEATAVPGGPRGSTTLAQYLPALAVTLVAAAAVSTTAPSSSGGGGSSGGGSSGGSGGVGGGTGGGGGGSW
ncbi:DUF2207 domain-containing protein [Streptomyces sp. VRA16 Mangrove soil]|uniref:DUF2207 domain-containing protein n=1 Tax=Streptomyces sp. VRA16 Mangrove soil TaxID=2817434 RepID=UPI001A9FA6A9|nr:DUF2207 domain-containing protein [Streptomyces sp. VRA16 Mangrove soil]MBO1333647.1 DUF2207 domain-containing protein [Streptomyces sp. VRA16 Mangrove soil]